MKVLGKCHPGRLIGCRSFPSKAEIGFVKLVYMFCRDGSKELPVLVSRYRPLPLGPAAAQPDNIDPSTHRQFLAALLADPRVGMLHWPKGDVLALRIVSLPVRVVDVPFMGDEYGDLVKSFEAIGLDTFDVEL